jgi:hypothetical protein
MNDRINDVLRLLRNIKPTAHELTKIKILMAAHGKWMRCVDIRKAANMPERGRINLAELVCDDLLEISQQKYQQPCGDLYSGTHYRTTKKGVEYLTKLMK